ncbi:hypothetical protein [Burkholderia pyrrocinia]|uniref:hypothetical protein n=1 Tax=Burkholderia pyrrocinia TaxID=60550 RepID=UPI002AAF80EA|nr:hypothetical protein [Burkholderia pyrrocinia]
MSEHARLQYASIFSFVSILCFVILLAMRPFPYPDNNLDGHAYLSYLLPRYAAEWQTILATISSGSLMMFVSLLALAYIDRAGRLTLATLVMIGTSAGYLAIQSVAVGLYMTAALLARGYPAFGNDAIDYKLVTLLWNAANLTWAVGACFPGMAWLAIASANRNDKLLPGSLGGAMAIVVAIVNFASLFSVFVPTGRYSPGSAYQLLLQGGSIWLWSTVVSLWFWRHAYRGNRVREGSDTKTKSCSSHP